MHAQNKPSIREWAEEDRPREKLIHLGAEQLSTTELIAILLQSGSITESAVDLAHRLIKECNGNLNEMAKWSNKDFTAFKGVGQAKFAIIKAALELGKRRGAQDVIQRKLYNTSASIYQLFHPILCDAPHEEFWILLLNQACRKIKHIKISSGGIDGTYVDIRTILREALLHRATQLAIIHNHPSGNEQPSLSDKKLTYKIKEASKIMDITLVDHLIVCDGHYYSFNDQGIL